MSLTEAHKLIQGLVRSLSLHAAKDNLRREHLTITLSRDHAAGGCEIARRLGTRLGLQVWDSEILRQVAEAAHVEPELMAELDEKVRHRKDAWFYNFLSGKNAYVTSYRYHLVNVVLAIHEQGGIILGRGAHLILANRPIFRLRIAGSEDVCAHRLAERADVSEGEARAEVRRINRERAAFLENDFGQKLDDASRFDLVVNTDRYGEHWEQITDLILAAMAIQGFKVSR